jgi:hypothetical protein
MRKLGDFMLPEQTIWEDQLDYEQIKQSSRTALDGRLVVFETAQSKGRMITLSWVKISQNQVKEILSYSQVQQLLAMKNTLGGVFNFIWDDATFQVMFAKGTSTHKFEKVRGFDDLNTNLFTGFIKLFTV